MKRVAIGFVILVCCVAAFADNPPKRPHIFGLAKVQVISSDLRATSKFYMGALRTMQPVNCPDCDKRPPTLRFSVNGVQEVEISPVTSHEIPNRMAEIDFATDDIPALRRFLGFNKIQVSPPKKSVDDSLVVSDPEGHRIGFRQWPASLSVQATGAGHTPDLPPHLIHAGIIVHDRAAEDHFYRDILGFHLYWHGGMKDEQTDWVSMQVPDGTDWIEYMLNVSASADKHTRGVMNHFALGVPDIHVAQKELLETGVRITEEPKIGRDGKWQLNLYDPDDTRVEFMEFTPKEKPCCSEFTGPHPGPEAGQHP
jgi:catechol 2,3-dioxygenase-like lactoylglutathione lyase family enzyme